MHTERLVVLLFKRSNELIPLPLVRERFDVNERAAIRVLFLAVMMVNQIFYFSNAIHTVIEFMHTHFSCCCRGNGACRPISSLQCKSHLERATLCALSGQARQRLGSDRFVLWDDGGDDATYRKRGDGLYFGIGY